MQAILIFTLSYIQLNNVNISDLAALNRLLAIMSFANTHSF